MTPIEPSAEALLCQEIRVEARREAEGILRQAREDAEALLARTAEAVEAERAAARAEAQGRAGRVREAMLAAGAVALARDRSERIEGLLRDVRDEVGRRATEAWRREPRAVLVALVAEAVRGMPDGELVLRLGPEERKALGDGVETEIFQRAGVRPRAIRWQVDAAMSGAGVRIEDAGGRWSWDNRLGARLERMWPELRRQIARHLGGFKVPAGGGAVAPDHLAAGPGPGT